MKASKFLFFSLSVLFTVVAPAGAAQTDAFWKAELVGRSTDDSLSNSRTVGVAGVVNVRHYFSDDIQARFFGGVLLEAGSASALFTNEFEPRSRFLLQEASLRWRLFHPVSVLLGTIDQRHHGSPLLVEGGSFPALMLALDHQPGNWIFHFDVQGALPTSRTFSTRSVGKDTTPFLFTQKATVGWEDRANGFKALLRASHFEFSGLTHGMAQDSRFYGNSISGPGPAARFVYRYRGFEAGPDFSVPLSERFSLGIGGSYIQNLEGPQDGNQGGYAYANLSYQADNFTLRPGFAWYLAQADASPGFFSSSEFGHNNRRGLGAGMRVELKQTGLNFDLRARRSERIQSRAFQRDRFDYVELIVEMPYARF